MQEYNTFFRHGLYKLGCSQSTSMHSTLRDCSDAPYYLYVCWQVLGSVSANTAVYADDKQRSSVGSFRAAEGHMGPMRNKLSADTARHLTAPYTSLPQQFVMNKHSQQAALQTVGLTVMCCLWCKFIVVILLVFCICCNHSLLQLYMCNHALSYTVIVTRPLPVLCILWF